CPLFSFSPAPATTATYTLSLHDALPIYGAQHGQRFLALLRELGDAFSLAVLPGPAQHRRHRTGQLGEALGAERGDEDLGELRVRSEEHTSELQSRENLVCRLLLEKKKNK